MATIYSGGIERHTNQFNAEHNHLYTVEYPFTGVPQYVGKGSDHVIWLSSTGTGWGSQVGATFNGIQVTKAIETDTYVQLTCVVIVEGDSDVVIQIIDSFDGTVYAEGVSGETITCFAPVTRSVAPTLFQINIKSTKPEGFSYPGRVTKAKFMASLVGGMNS